MPVSLIVTISVLAVVVIIAIVLWVTYSSLVNLRRKVDESWNDITVQLKQRADALSQLVTAVEAFAGHENRVFAELQRARAESISALTPGEASEAEAHVQQATQAMFAVAQSYPKLQSSGDFLQRQSEVADAENAIQSSRRVYNGGVRQYNTKIRHFPHVIVARTMGFDAREPFEVDHARAVAEPPRIQF